MDFGIEVPVRDTPAGSLNVSLDLTRINSYENTPSPGAEPVEIEGTFDRQFGNYAKYRGLLGVGWKHLGFDALMTLRYIHSLEVRDPDGVIPDAPPLQIPSFTYVDLTVGYTLPTNTRIQVGADQSHRQAAADPLSRTMCSTQTPTYRRTTCSAGVGSSVLTQKF